MRDYLNAALGPEESAPSQDEAECESDNAFHKGMTHCQ